MMKRILIVGSWGTTHVRRFLRLLNENKGSLVVDSFDPRLDDNQGNECNVDHVFRVNASSVERFFYSIRKFGTFLFERKQEREFERIVSTCHYDLVNIHFLPTNSERYVKIAHRHNTKVMLTPTGSDVLRTKKMYLPSLHRAFNECDYVSCNTVTGFYHQVADKFSIPDYKIRDLSYGSETLTAIIKMKGKYSRKEFCEMLGVPYSPYYICCGYTGSIAQRHDIMIEALAKNKQYLPEGYRLIIPLSYGPAKDTLNISLAQLCDKYEMPYSLLTHYLTSEQVACLRFISDLFIHIQPTDAYNASLQEFLLADTEVINGKWLSYPSLETVGMPYHILKSLEDLPDLLGKVLRREVARPVLSKETEKEIIGGEWAKKINDWVHFYSNVE